MKYHIPIESLPSIEDKLNYLSSQLDSASSFGSWDNWITTLVAWFSFIVTLIITFQIRKHKITRDMDIKNLPEELMRSIENSHLLPVGLDVCDSLISNATESEFVKSVPVLRSAIALYKDTKSYQNYRFVKKIYAFLANLQDVDRSEIYDVVSKIETENFKIKETLGEILIDKIQKSDSIITIYYLSQFFKCYLTRRISYDEFMEGARVINNLSVNSLISFLSLSNADLKQLDDRDCHDFYRAGLVNKLDIIEVCGYDGDHEKSLRVGKLYNRPSKIGQLLHDCLSEIKVNNEQIAYMNK
jgi:hypothetical protein